VLRINKNEAQLFEQIIEGLTPTQHARFVFQAAFSTFLLLKHLAVLDRNIAYADQVRNLRSTNVTVSAFESDPKAWNSMTSPAHSPTTIKP
jgi:hypothetical protein